MAAEESLPSGVTIEVLGWVTQFVGGSGSGRSLIRRPVSAASTVRSVLLQLTEIYPELGPVLWDSRAENLAGHVQILVNDRVLGITHGLDTLIGGGDRMTFLAQYSGG
jgi:molybdopterin converting factor small subunit